MICRNCSAEIDENAQVCPVCKKDPTLRDYDKKSGKRGPIVILLIAACLLAVCIFVGIQISNGKIALPGTTEPLTTQSSKSAFAFSDSETNDTETSSSAASASAPDTTQASTAEPQTTVSEAVTESTTLTGVPFSLRAPKIVTKKITDENTVPVAKYGSVFAQKKQIKALSQKKFYSFCKNTIGKSELKWLTIRFEDSTGLVFIGNDYSFASYCQLDENDFIKASLGKVILNNAHKYIYISENDSVPPTAATSEPRSTTQAESSAAKETTKATTGKGTEESTRNDANSDIVYITNSGTKYHRATCSYLSSSRIEIKLSEAKKKGYTPCSRCFG